MKGIILAGGLGTRLLPLTAHDNKHFLPVYNKRMIEYPLITLVEAGIKDIILVTGGKNPGQFLELLKNGHEYGIEHLYYTYQEGEGGIAAALSLAQNFVEKSEQIVVILGDNYFETSIKGHISSFMEELEFWPPHAKLLYKKVPDPERFGVAQLDEDGHVLDLIEKPKEPISNKAVIGCYLFDEFVWEFLKKLKPSDRGELEIVDVLKLYLKEGGLTADEYEGIWSDMGCYDSLLKITNFIAGK